MPENCETKRQWLLNNSSFCCGVIECFYCSHRKGSTDPHIDCVEHLLEVCSVKYSDDVRSYYENADNFVLFFLCVLILFELLDLVSGISSGSLCYFFKTFLLNNLRFLHFSKIIMFRGFASIFVKGLVILPFLRFYFCFCLI